MVKKNIKVKPRKLTGTLPTIRRGKPPEDLSGFPVKHYSHSSMVKFSTNPIMFKINYLNGDQIDSTKNISGVIGTAFHKAMEVYYRGNPDLMPADEAQAIEYGLKVGMQFLEQYEDGFIEYSEKIKNKQEAYDRLVFLFNSYVKEKPHNPTEELIATEECIEEHIDVEWRGHRLTLPVPLKGYIDKIIRQDGKLKIIDYKTCQRFSDPDSIEGDKIIQAIVYYLLVYAKYGEAPYSFTFEEAKMTKNKDLTERQIQHYEIVYTDHELYFEFFFRFYEDMTNALGGKMVYVPNVKTMFDNEVSIIAYIHRLDIQEEQARLMKELQVTNITDLLKAKIQSAGSMRNLLKAVEQKFVAAKNVNYDRMSNHEKIQTKLMEHGMMLGYDSTITGASVDLYRFKPTIGLKMSRLEAYEADVEQVLGISGIRVLAPIPGSSLVGFEVPRSVRNFPSRPANKSFNLAIGQTITGETRYFDLREAPHMLVAGAAGSGKSIFLSSIIEQLGGISNVDLHLYDPKMVELSMYQHLAADYQDDMEAITQSLASLVDEMDARYAKLKKAGVRNISGVSDMNYKVIVIDEFADLSMQSIMKQHKPKKKGKKNEEPEPEEYTMVVSDYIIRLAQKGRAAGMHIILATQRPSVDVISGLIKANFPVKAAFRTAKESDSRVILDEAGAEKLMGKGDMLFATHEGIERLQGFNI
jgi:DNA segregation ATPase FtsK/SpoIIIE and related proteins